MKRLVYAPKVWVFVRASNITELDPVTGNKIPKILDLSSDLVRGSVTQNLGDVSTARFEVRNRFFKWIRYKTAGENYNRQIFLPMDLVTIWMQRISGRPVQVFTGYLDSVPYYQGYPGTAIFEATCTLKKLAFTWFDPGLPVFTNWMNANGWAFDPGTGQVIAQTNVTDENLGGLAATSANFADILGRFLVDIGGWDPNDVVIGGLPTNIGEAAAAIRANLKTLTDASRKQLAEFYSNVLGVNGVTGIATDISKQSEETKIFDKNERLMINAQPTNLKIVDQIKTVATSNGLPPWLLTYASLLLTGFDTGYNKGQNDSSNWGFGMFAMRPNTGGLLSGVPIIGSGDTMIDGHAPGDLIQNPALAMDLFSKRLIKSQQAIPETASKAWNGNAEAARVWISNAVGYEVAPGGTTDIQAVFDRANQIVGTSTAKPRDAIDSQTPDKAKADQSTPISTIDVKNTPITDQVVLSKLSTSEQKVANANYAKSDPEMGYIVLSVKQFSQGITLANLDNLQPNQVFFQGDPDRIQRLFDALKGNLLYYRVELNTGGQTKGLNQGKDTATPPDLSKTGILITGNISLLDKIGTAKPNLPVGGGDGGQASLTLPQLAAFSANASFAANFAFNSDIESAALLVGAKALMNDTSCLDAVKQMTQGCLRTFRSLPDGRFMAFYPDYFGSTRAPYWKIYNIEITDFGIQLNDNALATHVYVIGDTMFADGNIDIFDQIASQGVATITMARMLDTFIEPLDSWNEDDSTDTRLNQAADFLSHYGARPHKEEMPLIRSAEFEFLMAWQRFMQLWAQQFATNATFTFQPEVMAGGLIEFPEHDIQMFCESVTHNFDYEGGFTTDAVLTAPSLTTGKRFSKESKPGFALGGGINTVGVSAG